MAEKYGKLPHEIEQNATTYDLMVLDVISSYDKHEHDKANGKGLSEYNYTVDELQAMMNAKPT
jgi:hypothetical protein